MKRLGRRRRDNFRFFPGSRGGGLSGVATDCVIGDTFAGPVPSKRRAKGTRERKESIRPSSSSLPSDFHLLAWWKVTDGDGRRLAVVKVMMKRKISLPTRSKWTGPITSFKWSVVVVVMATGSSCPFWSGRLVPILTFSHWTMKMIQIGEELLLLPLNYSCLVYYSD